jgi:alkanesulfonate monooxygenase SsuD/methylene tetrahydromethanopterin reductase-like flavin-dependent oxidoreductase (luciferase family)
VSASPEFFLFLPQMRMPHDVILGKARAVERAGFDGIAIMDHLAPPGVPHSGTYDAFVMATAIAMVTERIRIGHLVLCGSFRHPAMLAKEAVTLDHISSGRFDLGIGWGSVPDELERFDCGNEPSAVRAARLAETLDVIIKLWTGEVFDHHGRFWTMRAAQQQPIPVNGQIPIVIGGGGRKLTMPLVRTYAQWWNAPTYAIDELDELLPLAGDARISAQHPVTLGRDAAHAEELAVTARRRFSNWGGTIEGAPDVVAAALTAEARRGVERFYLMFTDFADIETLERFGAEVMGRRHRSRDVVPLRDVT